jgi:hypothetical protein
VKLIWKGIFLSLVVWKRGDDFAKVQVRVLVRVLNTNPMNIYLAMKRHRLFEEGFFSTYTSFTQKTARPGRWSHKTTYDIVGIPKNACESNSKTSHQQTYWTNTKRATCNTSSFRKSRKIFLYNNDLHFLLYVLDTTIGLMHASISVYMYTSTSIPMYTSLHTNILIF